jgi:hypothetical protein
MFILIALKIVAHLFNYFIYLHYTLYYYYTLRLLYIYLNTISVNFPPVQGKLLSEFVDLVWIHRKDLTICLKPSLSAKLFFSMTKRNHFNCLRSLCHILHNWTAEELKLNIGFKKCIISISTFSQPIMARDKKNHFEVEKT